MKEWVRNLAIAAVAILAPIQGMLITVGILVAADLITGVWAAKKLQQPITSAKLRTTVSKLLIYQIALITGFLVEKYMMQDLLPVSKLLAGAIGMVELTSLLENANKILGTDLFKAVVAKIGSSNAEKRE